jgi:hypothetical protein
MARRQIKYYEKPHVMDPEIRRRFQEFIDQGKKRSSPSKPTLKPKTGWLLYRWDTLEDVDQGD